ncbi:MAG: glycosyltransferase, partial [Rhodanobacter sp.]
QAMKRPDTACMVHVQQYLHATMKYAGWALPAAVLIWINSNGYMFVMPLYGDAAQTGGLRAVLNLVAPINTLLVGACTAWLPKLAELHRSGDARVYARTVHGVAASMLVITLLGGLLIAPFSAELIGLIYGKAYTGFAGVLRVAVGTSPSEQRRALEDIGAPPERVEHILNAVEVERLSRHRTAVARRRHIMLVARVSAQKNIPMYLDVVRILQQSVQAPCYLVGVGHYADDRSQLMGMMKDAGLREADLRIVEWLPRAELVELMADAAVVVLTSTYESFGYVLAEANCLGVPVVGTDVDGICDVIRDGHNGFLVPMNDAVAMAERIRMLLGQTDIWNTMSAAAYREASERFDIRDAMPRFEAFYARQMRGR